MDEVDIANERSEQELARAIQAARAGADLKPSGQCYNCGELVTGAALFCDVDCRDDHQKRMNRQA